MSSSGIMAVRLASDHSQLVSDWHCCLELCTINLRVGGSILCVIDMRVGGSILCAIDLRAGGSILCAIDLRVGGSILCVIDLRVGDSILCATDLRVGGSIWPACYQPDVYSCRTVLCISVAYAVAWCPSVCPSRSCILSKRVKISSKFFYRWFATLF